jgi:hemerythrin-like domain-containing protein
MNRPAVDVRESIDEVLGDDHRRLGGLLGRLREALRSRSPSAIEPLEWLGLELGHHMAWEEEELFPAVRPVANAEEKRHLESLQIDHERLRDALTELRAALLTEDYAAADLLYGQLDAFLQGHNADEERGVYVLADRALSPDVRRRLLGAFRTWDPERVP